MKILNKYIIKELLGPLFFGLFAFTSIFLGYLFIDLLRDAERYHFTIFYILKLISLRIPEYIINASPVAVLLAALLGLGNLTSHSETIAMRASGLSIIKLAIPVLIIGMAVSLGCLALNEYVAPAALQAYDQMKKDATSKEATNTIYNFNKDLYQDGQIQKLLYAKKYEPKLKELHDVVIQEFNSGQLSQTIEAKVMYWNGQAWFFKNGRIYQYGTDNFYPIIINQGQMRHYGIKLTPAEIENSTIRPERKSISELSQYIKKFVPNVDERKRLLVEWHTKVSIPFAAFVLAILGAPLALRPQRRSNAAGFGMCIIFIIIWYVLMGLGTSMSRGGVLPPVLGAWLPNILLAGYGISVFIKVKQ